MGLRRRARRWRARSGPGTSNLDALAELPPVVARAVDGAVVRGLPPSPPPKDHLLYDVGGDRILHRYGPPATRIRRSLPDRRAIDALGITGVPRLHAAAPAGDAVWLLEDRLPGAAPPAGGAGWTEPARQLLVDVAGPPGPPLRTCRFWDDHAAAAVAAAPAGLRDRIGQAWEAVGDLPARVAHGDAQPRNLVVSPAGIGLVDWEGAWRHGLPGLDLVFCALTSAAAPPDAGAVTTLVAGDGHGRPLRGALAAVGVDGAHLAPTLLAILSTLALGEQRRAARPGAAHARVPTTYRTLLVELAPRLAG